MTFSCGRGHFSGVIGDTTGVMLDVDERLVKGGVVSLSLDNDDDPVESFLAMPDKLPSTFEILGVTTLVGDDVFCRAGADIVPDSTGQAKSRALVELCIIWLRVVLVSSGLCLLKRSNRLTREAVSM